MMSVEQQHQKWITISILLLFTLIGCINAKSGYKCYTCVSQKGNNVCLDNPAAVVEGSPTVECDDEENEANIGWCTVVRQEYTDIPGEIVNFIRGCLHKEPAQDGTYPDETYTFFYSSCRGHLCNVGDGLQPLEGGTGGGGGSGGNDGEIIRVDPESSSVAVESTSLVFLSFALALMFLT